jgi:hypothetical protein
MRTILRTRVTLVAAGLLAAAAGPLGAQGDRQPPAVNQPAIDEAIKKGAEWLLEQAKGGLPSYGDEWQTVDELVLYALLHAGVDPKNPEVVKLLKLVAERVPNHTYTNAIRAQAMHKYDHKLLAEHLRGAAQWLIDNQSQRGFWGYGKEVNVATPPKITVTPDPQKVYSGPKGGAVAEAGSSRGNTTASQRVVLKRNGWGQENDNSNSQYALLGLAACMAAGFYPPQDCLDLAEKWFTDQQNEDGGWCYKERGEGSTGAMTAAGVSSLCVILRAKNNLTPAKDIRIQKGLKWLGDNLTFDNNPRGGWHYYWIYSVERAGSFSGSDWFGDRPWFKEGSDWLVGKQNGDGSWGGEGGGKKIADTAWAMLFLRRATRSIVISGPTKR